MLNFSASVLKMPLSRSRTSRRMTLSRVVVLPTNVMRLTKYCLPSCIRSVTSTIGGPVGAAAGAGAGRRARPSPAAVRHRRQVARRQIRIAGELHVAAAAVHFLGLLEALADLLLAVESPSSSLNSGRSASVVDDLVPLEVDLADVVALAFGDRNAQLHKARLLSLESSRIFRSGWPTRTPM